jgi:hypothetical protein
VPTTDDSIWQTDDAADDTAVSSVVVAGSGIFLMWIKRNVGGTVH